MNANEIVYLEENLSLEEKQEKLMKDFRAMEQLTYDSTNEVQKAVWALLGAQNRAKAAVAAAKEVQKFAAEIGEGEHPIAKHAAEVAKLFEHKAEVAEKANDVLGS